MALPYLRASLDSPRKHSFSAFPANFMANFRHRHVRREYHIVVLGAGRTSLSWCWEELLDRSVCTEYMD
ncbi:hypothetical protein GY632_7577 [Trichophyton interdigitale]|nr:hypothetical protein GY632_7577 [Trichophyton interdigitale]